MNRIAELIGASIAVKQAIMQDANILFKIQQCVDILVEKLCKGQKVLFCIVPLYSRKLCMSTPLMSRQSQMITPMIKYIPG